MKKSKNLFRLLRYDFRVGTRRTFWRMVFILFVLTCVCGMICRDMMLNQWSSNMWDCFYQLLEGTPEYYKDRLSEFRLPIIVVLFQMMLLFLLGNYAKCDICGYGKLVFLESGSRVKWWISKIIWTMAMVVLYYAMTFLIMGGIVFLCSGSKNAFLLSDSALFLMTGGKKSEFLVNLIVLPLLVSETFALWQTWAGVFLKPVWGYCLAGVLWILSAYKTTPLLIGNYSLLMRNPYFGGTENLTGKSGMIVCLLLSLILISSGMILMKKYDLLNKEE